MKMELKHSLRLLQSTMALVILFLNACASNKVGTQAGPPIDSTKEAGTMKVRKLPADTIAKKLPPPVMPMKTKNRLD
jgi:hypothetical protein